MTRTKTGFTVALLAATVAAFAATGVATAQTATAHAKATGSTYLSYGSKPGRLNLMLVASQSSAFGGLNFNGYGRGAMVVRIPVGSKVDVTFKNASTEMPHSVVITGGKKTDILRTIGFKPAFKGAETPDPESGITSGRQFFTFEASKLGRYGIVCAIPGHAIGGMWDYLQVVPKGMAPSITLGSKTITLKKAA